MWRLRTKGGFYLAVIALALVGGLLIAFHGDLGVAETQELVFGVGIAMVTGALLGLTVDQWLKKALMADAFRASMGYVLPEDLRGELRYLASLDVLCVEHLHTLELVEQGDAVVTRLRVERTFRNVSRARQKMLRDFAVDEWQIDGHETEITEMGYERGGRIRRDDWELVDKRLTPFGVAGRLKRDVVLAPDESVRTWFEATEPKRRRDAHVFFVRTFTVGARVTVNAPSTLEVGVDFATHQPEKLSEIGGQTWLYPERLLPYQAIRIQWKPLET